VVRLTGLIVMGAACLGAATLERLSLDQMAEKATSVVRGDVGQCQAAYRGRIIYTTCRLVMKEILKGQAPQTVSVPGGVVQGVRQTYAGAPVLAAGEEKVFFLWTGPSGMTQVLGLSQGLLTIEKAADGKVFAVRAPARDRMLDASGRPVADEGVDVPLDELRRVVAARGNR
jgi:hypothetical protein